MIDPGRSYKNPIPPPVHVEGFLADRKSYPPASRITLPPLTRDIQIDYTALSFVQPQRMRSATFSKAVTGAGRIRDCAARRSTAIFDPGVIAFA